VWSWITEHQAQLAAHPDEGSAVEPRERWPSWARHTVTSLKIPSATMFTLLDGLVSYLALVLITGAPTARWALGSPEDAGHHLYHHPVLTGAGHQVFVPTLPMGGMLRLKRGQPSLGATELTDYAVAVIKDLREDLGSVPAVDPPLDPPVVVVAAPEVFDVGVRADIVTEHPRLMGRMAAELTTQDGVTTVDRVGPDALEVHAPDLEADDLHRWLSAWLRMHLPFDT
jgi:hypothetical protein